MLGVAGGTHCLFLTRYENLELISHKCRAEFVLCLQAQELDVNPPVKVVSQGLFLSKAFSV